MGTLMRIECASNLDRLHSHECALTWCASDANPIESTSWGGLDAHSNRIALLFMIHTRLRLPWDRWLGWLYSLAWLMARVYGSFSFCSCSNVGEEIGLFVDGQVEWYSMVKLKAQWFCCIYGLQYLNLMYYSRPARCASGGSLRTAFQLVLVSWYFIFQSCVAFCCYV